MLGSIDPEELYKLLHKLGVDVDDKVVSIAMATYDLDGEGALEMNEFLQFLRSQHDEAISRLREMAECPIMCLANKPTERYIPPRRGILHLTVKDSFQVCLYIFIHVIARTGRNISLFCFGLYSPAELRKS